MPPLSRLSDPSR